LKHVHVTFLSDVAVFGKVTFDFCFVLLDTIVGLCTLSMIKTQSEMLLKNTYT